MDIVIEILLITTSVVLIVAAFFSVIYLIKRHGFYIKVNCWFCNGWTKVLYSERNSFCCPFCLQYNGFNEDGGYNKVIDAQFDTSFNKYHKTKTVKKTATPQNGLCTYCNYNQELKVLQLANFVPLQEKNFDIEVEHFQAQLEKSYKLCKKCEKVLKKTIRQQQSWIFGLHIRYLQKNGLSLLRTQKSTEFSTKCLSFIRCFLVFALIILCQALKAELNLESMLNYIPKTSKLNLPLIADLTNVIRKTFTLPITGVGLMIELLLLIWKPKSFFGTASELLGWIILVMTYSNIFKTEYCSYIKSLQIISTIAIIYSMLKSCKPTSKRFSWKNKFAFKKLNVKRNDEYDDYSSDEEFSEETVNSINSWKTRKESNSFKEFQQPEALIQNRLHTNANLNNTFASAKSAKSSFMPDTSQRGVQSTCSINAIRHNLENLYISSSSFKPQIFTSPIIFPVNSVNRPILSPPKLTTITQNFWTDGGFWKDDVSTFPAPMDQDVEMVDLSLSSSQSSGYVSNTSLAFSGQQSPYGYFQRTSCSPYSDFVTSLSPVQVQHVPLMNSSVNTGWNSSQLQTGFLPNTNHLPHNPDMFYSVPNQNTLFTY